MADDPYSQYLGLPPGKRPPRSHELLGLPVKPSDAAQVDEAAARCMDQLDQFALSNDRTTREQVQRLMNEVAKARTRLIAKVPKAKAPPERDKSASVPPKPAAKPTSAKPTSTPRPRTAASVPTPKAKPQPLLAGDRPGQSVAAFWALIATGWAVTLVVAYMVTFNIFKPDPPTVTSAYHRDAEPLTGPQETTAEAPIESIEPTGPTEEELLAQQQAEQARLTREREFAEKQRLALEQKRLEEARIEAERLQLEQIKQKEADRLAAEARKEEDQRELKAMQAYFVKRDRLSGPAQLELIQQMLSEVNGGMAVSINAEYEDGRITVLDLRGKSVSTGVAPSGNALITDLTPLAGMPLKKLDLGFCQALTNLQGLEGMPLEYLNLAGCKQLADISAIKGAPIETLHLGGVQITDLDVLRGMPLKKLSIYDCDKITTTAPLKGIIMDDVFISSCKQLKDISGLNAVDASDGTLVLSNLSITDLSPLAGKTIRLIRLQYLDNINTLAGLKGCTIETLQLEFKHKFKDLAALREVKITKNLEIESDQITDLSPLSGQPFRKLYIKSRSLKSIAGLENMRNLETLWLRQGTQISEQELSRFKLANPDTSVLVR